MEAWKQAVINASIMAGISALSILISTQEVTIETVKVVAVTFGITFLTLCARYFKPPKTDVNGDEAIVVETTITNGKTGQKKVLGALWF